MIDLVHQRGATQDSLPTASANLCTNYRQEWSEERSNTPSIEENISDFRASVAKQCFGDPGGVKSVQGRIVEEEAF